MDVFTLLRQDHQKVSSMFQQIQNQIGAPDSFERRELFKKLKAELDVHAKVEDLHVYRVFQQAEPTRDSAAQALEAHKKIKTVLDELSTEGPYDSRWVTKFQELQRIVQQHVTAEELEMFAKASEVLTAQEAEELGVVVEAAKKEIKRGASTVEGGTPE